MKRKKQLARFTRHQPMEFALGLIYDFEPASSEFIQRLPHNCPDFHIDNLTIVFLKIPFLNKRPRQPRAVETTLAG